MTAGYVDSPTIKKSTVELMDIAVKVIKIIGEMSKKDIEFILKNVREAYEHEDKRV